MKNSKFFESFMKAAASKLLEKIRMGLPISLRGQSKKGLRGTTLGRYMRKYR